MQKLTRLKAIRKKCIDCSENQPDVRNCYAEDCALYNFRMGKKLIKKTSPKKAIKEYCSWCINKQREEIKLCPSIDCCLYAYRGKNA